MKPTVWVGVGLLIGLVGWLISRYVFVGIILELIFAVMLIAALISLPFAVIAEIVMWKRKRNASLKDGQGENRA